MLGATTMRRITLLFTVPLLGAALGALAAGAGGCSPEERDFGAAGGPTSCEPGTEAPCYEGPEGTEGVGVCAAGTMRCNDAGDGYGACEGQVLPAAEVCATADDEDCDGASPACPLTFLWGAGPGLLGSNNIATAAGVTGDGGALVAGELDGSMDFGQGPLDSAGSNDAFVAKFDAATGAVRWAKRFGDAESQQAAAVAGDAAGNAYVAIKLYGHIDLGGVPVDSAGGSDVVVAQLKPNGTPGWVLHLGDVGYDEPSALAVAPNGEITVAGTFEGAMSVDGFTLTSDGSPDIFVIRLDATGLPLWAAQTIGGGYPQVAGVALDPQGNAVVAGGFNGDLSIGGSSAIADSGTDDAFVMTLDGQSGSLRWLRSFGGGGEDRATGVAVDASGGVALAGTFAQSVMFGGETLITPAEESFFLARLDEVGDVQTATQHGSGFGGTDRIRVAIDSQDNLVLAGYFAGTLTFGGETFTSNGTGFGMVDLFLAKLDPTGAHIASRHLGNDTIQIFSDVVVDSSDRIIAVGATMGALDLGGGTPIGPDNPNVATPIIGAYSP